VNEYCVSALLAFEEAPEFIAIALTELWLCDELVETVWLDPGTQSKVAGPLKVASSTVNDAPGGSGCTVTGTVVPDAFV
jgi:hypothetical protein